MATESAAIAPAPGIAGSRELRSALVFGAPLAALLAGLSAQWLDFRELRVPLLLMVGFGVLATSYAVLGATRGWRTLAAATLVGVATWAGAETIYAVTHVALGEQFHADRFGPQWSQAIGLIAAHGVFLGAPTGIVAGLILAVAVRRAHVEQMQFEDGPQLPLTSVRKILVAVGLAMFAAQSVGAALLAPAITGPGDANAGALAAAWCVSVAWSVATVLLLVRQADLPDVATASFLVTISAFAIFALFAALDVRGSANEVDLVDTMFLGITSGGLTALLVWAIATLAARLLRLPTTAHLQDHR